MTTTTHTESTVLLIVQRVPGSKEDFDIMECVVYAGSEIGQEHPWTRRATVKGAHFANIAAQAIADACVMPKGKAITVEADGNFQEVGK